MIRQALRLIVHHSGSRLSTTPAEILRWHTDPKPEGNGWSDGGYARVIDGDGDVHDMRRIQRIGAHARGHNHDSIGVCVVGNNLKAGQGWTPAQVHSLIHLCVYLMSCYPGLMVFGHSDVANTACPGLDLGDVLPRHLYP